MKKQYYDSLFIINNNNHFKNLKSHKFLQTVIFNFYYLKYFKPIFSLAFGFEKKNIYKSTIDTIGLN